MSKRRFWSKSTLKVNLEAHIVAMNDLTGKADVLGVVASIRGRHPEVIEECDFLEVDNVALEIYQSTDPDLPRCFTGLFNAFNWCHFYNSLPKFKVEVVYALGCDPQDSRASNIDPRRRIIWIRKSDKNGFMVSRLLHEMLNYYTYLNTEYARKSGMERLRKMGAPIVTTDLPRYLTKPYNPELEGTDVLLASWRREENLPTEAVACPTGGEVVQGNLGQDGPDSSVVSVTVQ